jgi:hypothetical protein
MPLAEFEPAIPAIEWQSSIPYTARSPGTAHSFELWNQMLIYAVDLDLFVNNSVLFTLK